MSARGFDSVELNQIDSNHHESVVLVPGETTFSLAALEEIFADRDLARIEEAGGMEGLAHALKTDLERGIPQAEAATEWRDRRTMFVCFFLSDPTVLKNCYFSYGVNSRSEKKAIGQHIFATWVASFKDATNILLAILATVLLVMGIIPAEILGSSPAEKTSNWIDALGIYAAVLIAATVQTINQWASDQQWRDLEKSRSSWNVTVMRGGVVTMVSKEEILVGDVVILGAGDRIPADGLFVSGDGTGASSGCLVTKVTCFPTTYNWFAVNLNSSKLLNRGEIFVEPSFSSHLDAYFALPLVLYRFICR